MRGNHWQFSLRGLFAFTVGVATLISFCRDFPSERSLHVIWVVSFFLSYCNSPIRAWERIIRVTAVTGIMWGVCVLWSYRLFVTSISHTTEDVVTRACLIGLAGPLGACVAACLAELVGLAVRLCRNRSWGRRVFGLLVLVLPVITWAAVKAPVNRHWNPTVVTSAGQGSDYRVDPVRRVEQQHGVKCMHAAGSTDGLYMAAILNGSRDVLVLDGAAGAVIAKLTTARNEWFADLAFKPDSHVLAAIVCSDATPVRLVRWAGPKWRPNAAIPLHSLVGQSADDECTLLSLDQVLLVVNLRRLTSKKTRVTISTIDLLRDELVPSVLVSTTIDAEFRARREPCTSGPSEWIVSPDGTWVAYSGNLIRTEQDEAGRVSRGVESWVFSSTKSPMKIGGRAIAFASNEHLLIYERAEQLVWKRAQTTTFPPPYWNHLRMATQYRVVLFDCPDHQLLMRSSWFTRLREPHTTPDGSHFVAEDNEAVLVWNLSNCRPIK